MPEWPVLTGFRSLHKENAIVTLKEWFAGGRRVEVALDPNKPAQKFSIFCRIEGQGPGLTLLHGFPTCSWDWVKVVDRLKNDRQLLMFDFLGFGDSDKPRNHVYSIFEQADITEFLWQHFDIKSTVLVAHDYGDTVALELLARQMEHKQSTQIQKVILLNGGICVNYQRPLLIQRLLRQPVLGTLISYLLNERTFNKRFTSIFSKSHPISESELRQHWQAIVRRKGKRNYHRIIQYLKERKRYQARWEHALEHCDVPIRFIWGLQDPVSGKSISDQIRKRLPDADLMELEDVGHYPQWEVPELIGKEILKSF
ncbi:alpha/beta hydrolase [candidate division KSB1 bacterium]|nr:alpha/beta hydrolase [candidate division KSB1 bacterium]NIR68980.1 alpha/beta hydrolase [candidate division KSB1 bacterium]NIS22602.1 alpha/beta hydrolase [candidate division KSB1 bacterium]NIT69462.1 alpha/beta hydrolase [candidate division KSB1 bacterium]NIU23117.1 alpha/beta hydrolase [candidate division KSB1 bacterium]